MSTRIHIAIRGAVQGVGFRPFIFKLANELNLNGYVLNNSSGVFIEAEGDELLLRNFLARIETDKPKLSVITSLEHSFLDPVGYSKFEIKESEESDDVSVLILPDFAVCDDCLNEMLDPDDRRYLYPFINCTNCGPRFSIIESLPYDRPNTSMKNFKMCDKCREEYENPSDRRFHAQPTACQDCGPQLFLWDENGNIISEKQSALKQTVELIRQGKIIALKGLGGFQLIVDATNDEAVRELRKRKHREEKPFALMFPSIESINNVCEVFEIEERVLCSTESPIVLVKKASRIQHPITSISEFVAPNNPYLGAMLPYTPIHHLLMRELNLPVVATSANLSEEPICIDEQEALERLRGIADYYLIHNRPIIRHVDDSIVQVIMNRELVIRRARGYAPLPVMVTEIYSSLKEKTILAVGGHLKNTVALKKGNNIFISQHIGDLSTEESNKTFKKVINDFKLLYNAEPNEIISDLHPEYISTKYAKQLNEKIEQVQHHFAHVAACRFENQVEGEALGVSWDGTGYGLDGTVWGGEFFLTDDNSYKHFAQFRKFVLPGGEKAIKEPRRSLTGILFEIGGVSFVNEFSDLIENKFTLAEIGILLNMLSKKINSPVTSSAGRLFDAVSSLLGICDRTNYEGQAAMMLEFAADLNEKGCYPFEIKESDKLIIDWQPIIISMINDLRKDINSSAISTKFHNTLAKVILEIVKRSELNKVVLSGGCFQNALLTERTINLLQENKYKVYWHQRIPPNDGGISLGQIAAYMMLSKSDAVGKHNQRSETEKENQLTKEIS
ncbi:MAG: carbamoyltransferase HypF [Ignavibacteriaceae bacterium]|nr:carbamoyltransferase HypF [Ignavibacteriaceae bacterium]